MSGPVRGRPATASCTPAVSCRCLPVCSAPLWVSLRHTKPVAPRDSAGVPVLPAQQERKRSTGPNAQPSSPLARPTCFLSPKTMVMGVDTNIGFGLTGRGGCPIPSTRKGWGGPLPHVTLAVRVPVARPRHPCDPVTWDVSSPSGALALRKCQGSAESPCAHRDRGGRVCVMSMTSSHTDSGDHHQFHEGI